ncbi:hypothetical protein DFH94DRAFT_690293 [Russula ochroleuca]|uniref:Uncharacterized protein n=1 Tax=Russula ochroleuca TaxID=152965 RepID=A0A9P5N199_9AGAM|nr:hypothetical protein DFH94DRAFT_690293 [Russula ochroleuca]
MAVSPLVRLPTYPTSTKALPFFGAYLLGAHPCLASEPAMPYVPTTRTVSLYFSVLFSPDVSAFRACLGLFRVLRSNYVPTTAAETTARSDASAAPYSSNERGDPRAPTGSADNARALDAVSALVLRYTSPLVRRAAVVGGGDSHGSRISGQALTAIILCATIVFCVLVGSLLQLPAAIISLRNRYSRSSRTGTPVPSTSNSMPGLFDVEMGDQIDQDQDPRSLACNARSPPPPYSRAPSYESSRGNTSTGGRGECTS